MVPSLGFQSGARGGACPVVTILQIRIFIFMQLEALMMLIRRHRKSRICSDRMFRGVRQGKIVFFLRSSDRIVNLILPAAVSHGRDAVGSVRWAVLLPTPGPGDGFTVTVHSGL